jgi:FTR1 family protein
MFDSLVVLIRESAEALFIISTVCVELHKAGKGRHLPMVAYGVVAGGLASLALSMAWPGRGLSGEESALLTIFASLAIGFIITEAVSSTASIRRRMSRALDTWLDSAALPAVIFAFSALVIFRESAEALFFLRLIASWDSAFEAWIGGVLGALVMAGLVVLWAVRRRMRRGLQVAFQLSSCLLVVMTVQALLAGLEALFLGYGAGHPDAHWATAVAQLLSNRTWHIGLLAALAVVPLFQMAARWRKEITIAH